MYAKVINPATAGRVVYANKSGSRRLTNYLEQEAKETGGKAVFFSSPGEPLRTADEVVDRMDQNHKGLTREADKFYSLVLSPSQEEQKLIGSDPAKLQQYTQNVMGLYAQNFQLKGGKELGEADLVWAATVHQERKNRGTDSGEQGEKKAGGQTHIHVIVSARDASQKITLNPLGRADRFNRVQFQAQAGAQLEAEFGRVIPLAAGRREPSREQRVAEKADEITSKAAANKREKKPLTPEQIAGKDTRLDAQVARINGKAHPKNQLDPDKVKEAAKARAYDQVFYDRLGRMERNVEKGTHTPGPYQYLTTGQVTQLPKLETSLGGPPRKQVEPPPGRAEIPGQLSPMHRAMQASMNKLASSLPSSARVQDVRSESEKEQELER